MDARTGITDAQSRARILALRANAKPEAQALANQLEQLVTSQGPDSALVSSSNLRRQIEVLERDNIEHRHGRRFVAAKDS